MNNDQKAGTVVITGASSGIGLASARIFAKNGWRVIATGRDPQRSAAAEKNILEAAAPNAQIDFVRGDFDLMSETQRVAAEIRGLADSIDVLINNAGGVRETIHITPEDIEATFAANHLAPFLLTRELLPLLKRSATNKRKTGRIIAVSSSAHEHILSMNWDDLMFRNGPAGAAYCQAKLANLLFTRELNRRVAESNIVAQAMHPGIVDSNFASHGGKAMQEHFATQTTVSPDHAAQTIYWLATSAEAGQDGGRYFHALAEVLAAPQARDDDAALKLWQKSEALLERLAS